MTAREKVRRDDQIVTARMQGRSWSSIAATFDLTERQCQAIMAEYRESHPRMRERDPIEILDDLLDAYAGAGEQLADIASTDPHGATRVGAIRTRLSALDSQTTLLMTVGVLPRKLRGLRDELDVRTISRELVRVLNRFDVPEEAQRELVDVLRARSGQSAH